MITHRWLAGWAVAALVGLAATVAQAQAHTPVEPPPQPDAGAAEWIAAVRAHGPGEVDVPLQTIAGWTQARTAAVLPPAAGTPADAPFLGKALTLHTDIAIVQRAVYERGLPTSVTGKTLLLDPKHEDARRQAFQWQVAHVIANTLAGDATGASTARVGYRATGAMLQQWGDCATLGPHLRAGLERFADDPVLLLLLGTLHQTFADVRVQRYLNGSRGSERLRRTGQSDLEGQLALQASELVSERLGLRNADFELDLAERALRRALGREATLVEARVRLAHVLYRRHRPKDALDTLQPLRDATLPPALEYYEAMIAGASHDALGHRREALVDGQPIGGLESLVDAVGPVALGRGQPAGDPWLDYFRFHEPDAQTLLQTFRETAQ